jgi:hypothetical protein
MDQARADAARACKERDHAKEEATAQRQAVAELQVHAGSGHMHVLGFFPSEFQHKIAV